jgi:hypothetical protein
MCVCMYVCVCACMCMYVYVFVFVCVCACVCVCVCVSMCMCMCMCMCKCMCCYIATPSIAHPMTCQNNNFMLKLVRKNNEHKYARTRTDTRTHTNKHVLYVDHKKAIEECENLLQHLCKVVDLVGCY